MEVAPGQKAGSARVAQYQPLVCGLLLRLLKAGPAGPIQRMVGVILSQVLAASGTATAEAYGLYSDILNFFSDAVNGKLKARIRAAIGAEVVCSGR